MKYTAHYASLLRIGIPIMFGQMGTIIMGFADTLMVGRYGTQELAAAGFVNNIMGLLVIGGMGFSYGLTPVVSVLVGEGRVHAIAGKLKNGLWANTLVGLLLMLLAFVLYAALPWLGLPADLLPIIRPYLLLLTVSLLPHMAFNAFKQFSDGIQDTAMPMWVMLFSNVLNVIGNWLLIFGHCGCPELGLVGAGIATLLSRTVQWVMMAAIFHLTGRYAQYRCDYTASAVTRQDQLQLHRLGWPVALQLGMESASFSLSAIYVGWLGMVALAAHQIMLTVAQLFFMLYYGMSAAVAVRVSYHRGRGEMSETRRASWACLHLNALIGICLAIPLILFRNDIGPLFSNSTAVTAMFVTLLPPFLAYQVGDALQCTYANALRGMERVKPMVWIAFVAYFIVSLPLGYFFGFICHLDLVGVWMAFPFGLTTAGLLYLWQFLAPTASPDPSKGGEKNYAL